MTSKNKLALSISLALFAGTAIAAPQQADDQSLLVVFKPNLNKEERVNTIRQNGGMLGRLDDQGRDFGMRHIADGRIAKIKVRDAAHRDMLIKRLSRHPLIEVAEPNYTIRLERTQKGPIEALATPNDPGFGDLWGLHNTGQAGGTPGADIDATAAWDITTGDDSVVIGVIDSGVDYTHPDLADNMWVNPGEVCDNGIDDDGNGYVDDCYGISTFYDNGDPMDENGHGTHVAGTIGATGNNGSGVTGVNWDIQMIGCQFLDAEGYGSTSDAIECLDYFLNLKENYGVNVVASNNSWGGGPYSQALYDAIEDSNDAGILFVAASGNDGIDADVLDSYPASYDLDGIVAVANTTRTDSMSGTSTYGLESVDLGAPGTEILSTYLNGGYATASGTSMASPHVAGVAGLVWGINPELSLAEMKDILLNSGDSIAALAGVTVSGKRLNALNALLAADPDPAYSLSVTPARLETVAGGAAVYSIDVGSIADWQGDVQLSASSDLDSLDLELADTSAQPGDTVQLVAYTDDETPWGEYALTVSGSDVETGELLRDVQATLYVLPQGISDFDYQNNESTEIPDNNPDGIDSVINVADQGTVFGTEVSVDITHTWIGDLIVTLTSPEGNSTTLHNRVGGDADDLVETFTTDAFNGEEMNGDWTLNVSDNAGLDTGTLNNWSLTLSAVVEDDGLPDAPVASFSYSASDLTVSFTDESSDRDSENLSYEWDFGDGATSSEQNPVHTYAEAGSYNVSLTVTDETELSDSSSQQVTVALTDIEIELFRANVLRNGSAIIDLRFSGATGPVDVYRDGEFVETIDNIGRYRDRFTAESDQVEYKLCAEGTEACAVLVVDL